MKEELNFNVNQYRCEQNLGVFLSRIYEIGFSACNKCSTRVYKFSVASTVGPRYGQSQWDLKYLILISGYYKVDNS